MAETSIEWTDWSVNPIRARWRGTTGKSGHYCEKVSPGCKNCYSSRLQPRFGMPPFQEQRMDSAVEVFLEPRVLEQVLRRRTPTKIFWCDMTDMFGRWVPNEWIAACFGVMAATPQHTHQVLTKRAERLPQWFAWVEEQKDCGGGRWQHQAEACRGFALDAHPWRAPDGSMPPGPGRALLGYDTRWPLPNVHLGVSAEDQQRADERIPHLLSVPAAVRWVSAEPLLGPIDFGKKGLGQGSDCPECGWMVRVDEDGCCAHCGADCMWYGLDWLVVGGESGPKARPMELAWARDIVQQCKEAGVPVFTKQLGARPTDSTNPPTYGGGLIQLRSRKGGDPEEWPEDLRVREFPGGAP